MSRLFQGGRIDRAAPLKFTFDGRSYSGYAGDTLASALVANDVRLVGRSFKYHRPRGLLTAGGDEPNGLVTLGRAADALPNTRATTVELVEGLSAVSQNRWPSLRFDVLAANQLFAPIFVAGFYYKTFMWPASFWEKAYEPLIRRAAGLGALSGSPDPDTYDRAHGFCDLLVIGGGPAGLSAALTAGRAGLKVFLIDDDIDVGGRLLSERRLIDDAPAELWRSSVSAELASMPNVKLLTRTSVFGVYDGGEYGAVERLGDVPGARRGGPRERLWKIIARRSILAAGALERPLVFGGNDRPGVMKASAVQTYVNRYAASPGKAISIFTTTDTGWAVAADLLAAGLPLAALIDARPDPQPSAAAVVRSAGVEVLTSAVVKDAWGAPLRAIDVHLASGGVRRIATDCLAVSGGWDPTIGLGAHMGTRPVWSEAVHSFLIQTPPPGMIAAGAAAGDFGLAAALEGGRQSAVEAANALGLQVKADPAPGADDETCALRPLWSVRAHRGKAFVDLQNDVTDKDVALAAREGFVSVEHMKRYTTLGMATDQGKTSQVNGLALLAEATARTVADTGVVLSRPPFAPVSIGALAGHHRDEHFRPVRRTAGHAWAQEQGAVFTDAGQWKRAQWFAQPGESDWLQSVIREVSATRGGVGICDVSTLGKIELHGPDAAALLDRLYVNTFSTLAVGKARYGLMLREDGLAFDDGTTTRLGEAHFFMTTTTANAGRVMQHIDFARQVLWPELDVQATSVTEQWATYAVAGPRSRELISALLPSEDVSDAALPYMGYRPVRWRRQGTRLYRLSFSGELAYEISVPAALGGELARALFDIGRPLGVSPYGTEALGVMRIEKGHVAGPELNGQTTASDLGLGKMVSKKKAFIGRYMAERPGLTDPERPALVGLRSMAKEVRVHGGAHVLEPAAPRIAANDLGYVTSTAYSPSLGQWIALALVKRGRERHGETLCAVDPLRGYEAQVEVCSPVFVDPEGNRLRG
ncbi:MAG: sarcosine oxidase subunit alpha family protein [Caulobacteraceae bacterium]